jgi:hypothetical protein
MSAFEAGHARLRDLGGRRHVRLAEPEPTPQHAEDLSEPLVVHRTTTMNGSASPRIDRVLVRGREAGWRGGCHHVHVRRSRRAAILVHQLS